jgi:alpha(1,3/1,4) fucosyltransferase
MPLKIGIPYKAHSTAFGSGKAQAVIAIAEVCKAAGQEVVLLQQDGQVWWGDIVGLESGYTILPLTKERLCDVVLDIDGCLNPDLRSAVGDTVIAFFRSDPSFEYLEKAAYMSQEIPYSLQGVHEVWVWDRMVGEERVPLLETMMENLPVRRLPYVWTPALLQQYLKRESIDLGSRVQPDTAQQWTAVISEKNTSNTSSCILPLLGAAKAANIGEIILSNAAHLKDNKFFQENLVRNGVSFKSPEAVHYEGRIRYADLATETACLFVSHMRHVPFRPGLLDLVWLGLPLVHNCEFLQSVGGYYPENDLDAIVKAIETFTVGVESKRTFVEDLGSIARAQEGWMAAFGLLRSRPVLKIGFTDMWEGFDPEDNFFLDLMQSVDEDRQIVGSGDPVGCALIICGPFGKTWQTVVGPRKVYYSGEPPMQGETLDSRIDLYLTHSPVETDHQMRLPMWPLFVEWFGKESKAGRNPNRLPKELLLQPGGETDRSEFCAFVVSNPLSKERNEAFETLNIYKPVNSGGRYKNNIGGPLPAAYAGGGGGDQVKVDFFKKHRFCICYENSVAPGYVTEKLMHAKMAGCIPLYRGAPEAVLDFDPKGFVQVEDGQDLVQIVRDLEGSPERMAEIAAVPALDLERFNAIQERLKGIGWRLIDLAVKPREPVVSVQPAVVTPEVAANLKSPLFVSFATQAYLSSLRSAIQSVEGLRRKDGAVGMRVYLGTDVSGDGGLLQQFPWISVKKLPAPSPSFPDQFEPKMFGWKLWLLRDLCHDPDLEGESVIYADAGSMWFASPQDMLAIVEESGVCLLKDRNQINRTWCSPAMIAEMGVTEAELGENQLLAACIGFQANHPAAMRLFDEAWMWGCKKNCLFGQYIAGVGADGKPFGHRHDQSILSILSLRQHCSVIDAARFACENSIRKTYQKSAPLYLHRGAPVTHKPVIPGIDDVWVISLDRRPDRWQSLMTAHPNLLQMANRLPGIDGKELQLTQSLVRLFAPNDFKWKKSVTGCALSHVLTWAQLASEHPSVQNYLILEDDCRFVNKAGWTEDVAAAIAKAPANADLLMLGGVLPNNLKYYPSLLEPVNEVWATIKPNNLFDPSKTMPFFHFCAYSYILTRTGAKKLMAAIQANGIYTSIDHFLMHPAHGLTTYVLKDLISTCFQAEDPIYKTAAFDDFLRVDSYDSDIWNNKECFPLPEIDINEPIELWESFIDVLRQAPHSIQTRNTLRKEAVQQHTASTVYYCPDHPLKKDGVMEEGWLKSLWPTIQYLPFPTIHTIPSDAWLLIARPALEFWQSICKKLHLMGKSFNVLHLSDEACDDPIEFYQYSSCKKVIRNYARGGLDEKVRVLPLGWAAAPPTESVLPFEMRPFVWGFHGTSWSNREQLMKPLMAVEPHSCKFIPEFQHKSMSGPGEYRNMLLQSQCVPIPRGNHAETFRLYEALEHGAIPFYVRLEGGIDREYWSWLRKHLHLMEIASWDKLPAILELFRKYPEKAEAYRAGLLDQWTKWKEECRTYFP